MTLHHEPKLHLSTSRPSRGMSAWASPVVSLGPWISPVGASEPTKMNKDGCTAKHFMEIWLISSCVILYVTVCIMYWYDIQVLKVWPGIGFTDKIHVMFMRKWLSKPGELLGTLFFGRPHTGLAGRFDWWTMCFSERLLFWSVRLI